LESFEDFGCETLEIKENVKQGNKIVKYIPHAFILASTKVRPILTALPVGSSLAFLISFDFLNSKVCFSNSIRVCDRSRKVSSV
jgi:hypothetical protein